MNEKKPQYFLRIALAGLLLLTLLNACAPNSVYRLTPAPVFNHQQELESLSPTWDNQKTDALLQIDIFLEPYRQAEYMQATLTFMLGLSDAHIRIFDYIPRSDSESFMVTGIGQCIADQSSDLYLTYLNRLVETKDIHDELVMASLAKEILGKHYDRKCLQAKIKGLKQTFENDDPLEFTEIPATIINGAVFYGDRSVADWEILIEASRNAVGD